MKIFFDHQTFSLQNYGGISRYFSELITGINNHHTYEALTPFMYSNNEHLPKVYLNQFLPGLEFPKKKQLLYEINKKYSINVLKNNQYDLVHPTYYDPYFIKYTNKPFVVTFLDMIHEKFSKQYKELAHDKILIRQKYVAANKATAIIAISNNTKQDIVDTFKVNPEKITVIYLGTSINDNKMDEVSTANSKETPYFLFVGNRGSYKNFDRFLIALAPIVKLYGVHIICAGGGPFQKDELQLIVSLGIASEVHQKRIDDTILASLYSRAVAFIFPSIYEGFGIPVLEAFSCSCPCILSNNSSLPEVGGEAALYIDPMDIDSIRNATELILSDKTVRKQLIDKGTEQLKKFSWKNTVNETVSLYSKI